jgi:dihydroorotase
LTDVVERHPIEVLTRVDLVVRGGIIVAISHEDALPEAREAIDATGKYILPGVIDPHVHFRSPGYEYKEDWATGTAIDMLATDRAPHAIAEKTGDDIWESVSGFGGLETAMPLLLTEVNRGRIPLEQYARWTSLVPAKVWGLYPKKGALQVGADADLVIVDLLREGTIRAERFRSKSKITSFEGIRTKGQPVCTIVRGRVVMREGELEGPPGWGQMVTRQEGGRPR